MTSTIFPVISVFDLSFSFVKRILSAKLAESGGHIPASNIARESEEYLAFPHHQTYGDVNNYPLNSISPYYYEAFIPVFSLVASAMSDPNYNGLALLNAAAEEGEQAVVLAQLG